MAIECPTCGRQYDVTLFGFGRSVRCVCGATVSLEGGHRRPREQPHITRLLMVCHGDAALAHRIAESLHDEAIDAIYASDAVEAIQTARVVNESRLLLVHTRPALREPENAAAPSDVMDRAIGQIEQIAQENVRKLTLIIAGQEICLAFLSFVLGRLPDEEEAGRVRPGECHVFEYRPAGWLWLR